MRSRLFVAFLIPALLLMALFIYQEYIGTEDGLLKEEAKIIEKHISNIQDTFGRFQKAERTNQLQNMLDLKRKLNESIFKLNSELRKCTDKYKTGIIIPFRQTEKQNRFDVKEVKLIGCRFNDEIMDIEIQLIAVAKAKNDRNDSLTADLLNKSGESLAQIKFYMTNDFTMEGKTVNMFSHTNGFKNIKSFTGLIFN